MLGVYGYHEFRTIPVMPVLSVCIPCYQVVTLDGGR